MHHCITLWNEWKNCLLCLGSFTEQKIRTIEHIAKHLIGSFPGLIENRVAYSQMRNFFFKTIVHTWHYYNSQESSQEKNEWTHQNFEEDHGKRCDIPFSLSFNAGILGCLTTGCPVVCREISRGQPRQRVTGTCVVS
jgi:hypothetical protein